MAAKKKATTKKKVTRKRKTNGPNKSEYIEDVMPERAGIEMDGEIAPRANARGAREGHVSPGQRQYSAKYEMVDANTAMQRAIARQNGELPPIQGGLDDRQSEMKQEETMTDDFDPLGDPQPGDPELEAEERKLAELEASHGGQAPVQQVEFAQREIAPARPKVLAANTRVTLELQDGLMTMPAIDVLIEAYGVTILLPLSSDGVTFIPKPGSSVTISHGGNRWPCYFPGTHFTWDEMNCMGLVFVRADEE